MRQALTALLAAVALAATACTPDADEPTATHEPPSSTSESPPDSSDRDTEQVRTDATRASALIARPAPASDLRGDDAVGDAGYNQTLSEQRAASVARVLIDELDVDEGLLAVRGFGFDQPVADETTADGDDDPDGRARNRRVEITLVGTG